MTRHAKVIIVGSGPAGCTAGVYASRACLAPVVLAGMAPGGQLMTTTDVDNWPGDDAGVQGPDLMERFLRHARRFGGEVVNDAVASADLSRRPFILTGAGGDTYKADCLIIAAGARAKYLGLDSERRYLGRGVSACATCDGFFYRGKPVAVVGGGNTAMEEALYLANLASKVTVIHRRDSFRAEAFLQNRLREREAEGKAEILYSHTLEEITGDDSGVSGIIARDLKTGALVKKEMHGVFIAIGHEPDTAVFAGQVEMENGYIITRGGRRGGATASSVAGVFAAGDAQDAVYRQAVTAAGSGCMAALDAQKFLEEHPASSS